MFWTKKCWYQAFIGDGKHKFFLLKTYDFTYLLKHKPQLCDQLVQQIDSRLEVHIFSFWWTLKYLLQEQYSLIDSLQPNSHDDIDLE